MRFTCCLNIAFNLTKPVWALICLHNATLGSDAALTDHFAYAFVCENVTFWRRYGVRKFDAGVFYLDKSSVRKRYIVVFKQRFQCGKLKIGISYPKITIVYACFVALTLAGPSDHV